MLVVRVREEPAALLVLDVCADFAKLLRASIGVQVVVLGLEVHSHEQQCLPCCVVGLAVRDAADDHRQRHGQVEGVERGLVLHEQLPPAGSELLERAVGTDGVQELAALRLEGGLQEEVLQPGEVLLLAEVALEHLVDVHLDHQEVVGRQQAHVVEPVPAWIPATSERSVHHVIGHEHASLQQLHGPAQDGQAVKISVRRRLPLMLEQLGTSRNDDEPAVHLAPLCVVVQGLRHPLDLFCRHLVQARQLGGHLLQDHLPDTLE
mmetsp:Transcript_43718/g.126259  ORF Transcript_43718/g.126259 Transcript_43718/m.126259 type:complete len:263 (-) Transcript_43718:520-1308(-)